jgi:hypothetical protein
MKRVEVALQGEYAHYHHYHNAKDQTVPMMVDAMNY